MKPKNKGHMNFYECCDLTENVYLLLHSLVFKEKRVFRHHKESSLTLFLVKFNQNLALHSALKWENIVVVHYLKNIQSLAMYTREFKECPLLKNPKC